jgi:hypothetical protein
MPSLIGNKPNQVPSNGDLGTMAFREQDQFVPTSGIGSTVQAYSPQLQSYATEGVAMRNRIINGAMVIDQRNAGASVTQTASVLYTLDRWSCYGSVTSKYTIQQNAGAVTPPIGFTNYLGVTSSSAYSVGASESFAFGQFIEGYNVADLGWGTANAKTVTLSFWVRSSLTGTFGGVLQNDGLNRSYPYTFTISSANTWEQKSVTIAGDTSGTWLTTNGRGLIVRFGLGAGATVSGTAGAWAAGDFRTATGATSVVGTNGATFYITGVQLEKGTQATSFEYRQYGQELALCQRYLPAIVGGNNTFIGYAYTTNGGIYAIPFLVTPRTAPTGITSVSGSFIVRNSTNGDASASSVTFDSAGTTSASLLSNGTLTAGTPCRLFWSGGTLLFTGCEL